MTLEMNKKCPSLAPPKCNFYNTFTSKKDKGIKISCPLVPKKGSSTVSTEKAYSAQMNRAIYTK